MKAHDEILNGYGKKVKKSMRLSPLFFIHHSHSTGPCPVREARLEPVFDTQQYLRASMPSSPSS